VILFFRCKFGKGNYLFTSTNAKVLLITRSKLWLNKRHNLRLNLP